MSQENTLQKNKKQIGIFDDISSPLIHNSPHELSFQQSIIHQSQKILPSDNRPYQYYQQFYNQVEIQSVYELLTFKEGNLFSSFLSQLNDHHSVCQKLKAEARKRVNQMLRGIMNKYSKVHKKSKEKNKGSQLVEVFISLFQYRADFKWLTMFIKKQIRIRIRKVMNCEKKGKQKKGYVRIFIRQMQISLKCIYYVLHTKKFKEGYSYLSLRHMSKKMGENNKIIGNWKKGIKKLSEILEA